jgi:hypothetical protein
LFVRYHRSERALLPALAEMYVQGVCLSAADLVIAVVQGRRYIGRREGRRSSLLKRSCGDGLDIEVQQVEQEKDERIALARIGRVLD